MSAWVWLAALLVLLVAAGAAALSSPLKLHVFATYPAQTPLRVNVRWLYGLLDVDVDKTPGGSNPSTGDDRAAARPSVVAVEETDEDGEPGPPEGGGPPQAPGGGDWRSVEPEEGDLELRRRKDLEGDGLGGDGDPLRRLEGALDRGVQYMETRSDVEKKVKMALAVVRTQDFPLTATRFLRDLVAAVSIDRVGLRAGFGTGSPAETGKLFGQLQAAFAWTHATERVSVDLDPDFHAVGFQGGADVALEARTWDLLRPIVVFALAPPTIRAIKNARRVDENDGNGK